MAQLKNTSISDTGFLQLPAGTTAQRPGSLGSSAIGIIRYNTDRKSVEWYDAEYESWFSVGSVSPIATGGTVADITQGGVGYRVHSFTLVGTSTFTATRGGEVEYLIVGGGASGGSTGGGGGGAGGVLQGSLIIDSGVYSIVVGGGGNRATGWNTGVGGENGDNSSAFGLTAFGGGHGGDHPGYGKTNGTVVAKSGGCGGGGRQTVGGYGTPGQGNAGGFGAGINGARQGGGGGAGSPGERGEGTGATSAFAGNGGQGISSSISGNLLFYAGGGGTGWYSGSGATSSNVGKGGIGGGGDGGFTNLYNSAMDGEPNTGGGGGGGGYTSESASTLNSGAGGSGIVIVRYRTS